MPEFRLGFKDLADQIVAAENSWEDDTMSVRENDIVALTEELPLGVVNVQFARHHIVREYDDGYATEDDTETTEDDTETYDNYYMFVWAPDIEPAYVTLERPRPKD